MNKPDLNVRRQIISPLFVRLILIMGLCLAAAWFTYHTLLTKHLAVERHTNAQRLDFYELNLEATLERHESLPWLLALERDMTALLEAPNNRIRRTAANRYLENVQQRLSIEAAYLMDIKGNTLAASNWAQPKSFIGQNYRFRPYFHTALTGHLGRFYGIGTTTGKAGYFLAAPIQIKGQIFGVIAIKVNLNTFETALMHGAETILVADAEGVIFLSSIPEWRYRTLFPLPDTVRRQLTDAKQYGDNPLLPIADSVAILPDTTLANLKLPNNKIHEFQIQFKTLNPLGWQVILLTDPTEAQHSALSAGIAAGFATAFLMAILTVIRLRRKRREELRKADAELRRVHAELETRIAERTNELTIANISLEKKVETLRQTEAILHKARDESVQAGKLAVLGQMSAGMSHELNQPLTALRMLSDNATQFLERGEIAEVQDNLTLIAQLSERMGRIVTQLKTFSRKEPMQCKAVAVSIVIEHTLLIIEPRRRETGINIIVSLSEEDIYVLADSVGLEQVLVNLLRNALDAQARAEHKNQHVELLIKKQGSYVLFSIRDHGTGISADALPHLFEPFYTTKPLEEGLGLGLAISLAIAESLGGTLSASNTDEGAEFILKLEAAEQP